MTRSPLPLSQLLLDEVQRDGVVELGTFSQPQLLGVDLDLSPGPVADREMVTTFERLDPESQAREIAAARETPVDPEIAAVVASVIADPMVRGSWRHTPPWYQPLTATHVSTLLGTALPDGSMACLDAETDLSTSQVTVTIRSLPALASRIAADHFRVDPPAPPDIDATEAWGTEGGAGLGLLSLVWAHGRGTRAVNWRITRTNGSSPTTFLQARRDYGLKKSVDDSVTEPVLVQRLQDMVEEAWSQAR
jgi:hypothetical protein